MHTPEQGLGKARGAGERAQAGSLSSKEPDSGLNPMTLRSRPEPKSRVGHNCPSSPGTPVIRVTQPNYHFLRLAFTGLPLSSVTLFQAFITP